MTTHRHQVTRLAHLAWVMTELLYAADLVRIDGWCLGEIRPAHLGIGERGVYRAKQSLLRRISDVVLQKIHERWLHDASCETLGISVRALRRLLYSTGDVRGRILLEEALKRGFTDCIAASEHKVAALASWERVHGTMRGADFVAAQVARVVTPFSPTVNNRPVNEVSPPNVTSEGDTSAFSGGFRFRGLLRSSRLRDGS